MDYPNRFIESYVHNAGIGVLVELGISGSVVPNSDVLARLAKDLAMHIAAMAPISVGELLQQPSVMNPEMPVSQIVSEVANELCREIAVLRFVRWVASAQDSLGPEPPRSPAVIYNMGNSRKAG